MTAAPATASERLISAARQKSRERQGTAVQIRLPDAVKARAERAARVLGYTIGEFVNVACRRHLRGLYPRVASDENARDATREASAAVWVRSPPGMPAAQIRAALLRALEHCEPTLPEPFHCDLVEGRDYLIERNPE